LKRCTEISPDCASTVAVVALPTISATVVSGAEIPELALDLGLDVQRRLAPTGAAFVAGVYELADLVAQGGVGRRMREAPQLGLDIERRLPPPLAPGVLSSEHLADLVRLLGRGGRRGGRRLRPVRLVADGQAATADLVIEAGAVHERRHRDDGGQDDHHEDDHAEGLLHNASVPLWRRFRRRTFAPNRPAIFPERYGLVLLTALALAGGIAAVVLALRL
jgi:hypothetical protein